MWLALHAAPRPLTATDASSQDQLGTHPATHPTPLTTALVNVLSGHPSAPTIEGGVTWATLHVLPTYYILNTAKPHESLLDITYMRTNPSIRGVFIFGCRSLEEGGRGGGHVSNYRNWSSSWRQQGATLSDSSTESYSNILNTYTTAVKNNTR